MAPTGLHPPPPHAFHPLPHPWLQAVQCQHVRVFAASGFVVVRARFVQLHHMLGLRRHHASPAMHRMPCICCVYVCVYTACFDIAVGSSKGYTHTCLQHDCGVLVQVTAIVGSWAHWVGCYVHHDVSKLIMISVRSFGGSLSLCLAHHLLITLVHWCRSRLVAHRGQVCHATPPLGLLAVRHSIF